jgi:chemotaxis response regulator CheB
MVIDACRSPSLQDKVDASRVIGVILTGMLDDGPAGLIAIQKCGGICGSVVWRLSQDGQ